MILLSNVSANRPYIDTFTVSSQADLNNAIAEIQVGGNDAVAGGSYQINITDPSIPTDALTGINLPTGAALTVVDDSKLTVSISGTVTEGSTLTATPTIGDSNDTGATVSYQWQSSTDGSIWSSISGATGSTYVLADADENKFVRVQASFTNNTGVLVSANSAPTATTVVDNSSLSVSISGTVRQGSALTATPTIGDSDDTSAPVSYQWQSSTDGSSWSDISSATGSTYTIVDTDDNKFIRVHASFTDDTSVPISANSAATATRAVVDISSLSVSISGPAKEGAALTGVTVATFSDANPNATVNDFTAMITWGDGGTSAGTVVATGNVFAITATDGAPVSTPVHTVVSGAGGKTYAVSELFTVSDADGDAPTQYDFWDNGAGGGHWSINGVPQASNQDILVNASQLSQVTYQAGSGTDTIYLRATDGLHFGAWTSGVTVANAPVANLNQSAFILSHTQSTAASTLFTATDADSDPIIQYDFWDNGAGGGHWSINGVAQGSNTEIMVTASQLSQVTYTPGAGTDTLFVRVNDRSGARGHRASPPPTGHP